MSNEHAGGEDRPERGTMSAAAWDDRYRQGRQWSVEPNRFVVAQLDEAPLPVGRALDLGCGEGRNAVWLAERGWEVLGLDLSAVACERARDVATERGLSVELRVGDAVAAESELAAERGEGWDLVLVSYLHVPPEQRRRLLAGVRWALAPGATLLLVGHDRRNHVHGWGGPSDPDVLWSPTEVTVEFAPTSYRVDTATVVERAVETDLGPRVALDTLVRVCSAPGFPLSR